MSNKKTAPPKSVEDFKAEILDSYESLSKRLQQIAKYVIDAPNDFALETVAVLAERCGVQPSTIVRFAKWFGFDGASQMQRLFRDDLLAGNSSLGYAERIRQFNDRLGSGDALGPAKLLSEFIESNTLALGQLREDISHEALTKASKIIRSAALIYVVGFGRSFPVASYIAYALHRANKRAIFIDGTGGFNPGQMKSITKNDAVIAVSFQPYSSETVEAVSLAAEQNCKIVTISDSEINPLSSQATVSLKVKDGEVRQFRSLSVSLCLAQALIIGSAFEAGEPSP